MPLPVHVIYYPYMIKQVRKLGEFFKNLPISQKILWGAIVILSLLYFDLYSSVNDFNKYLDAYNKRVDDFNADSYRESIRQVVQAEIDKSFENYQVKLNDSIEKYQEEINNSIANYEGRAKSSIYTSNDTKEEIDRIRDFIKKMRDMVCEHDAKLTSSGWCYLQGSRF